MKAIARPLSLVVVLLWALVFLSTSLAADATLKLSNGETQVGTLQQITADQIVATVDEQIQTIATDQVRELEIGSPPQTAPAMSVVMRNGSLIRIESVTWDGESDRVTLQPRRQAPVEIPISSISAMRFRPGSPGTDASWLGLLATPPRSDVIVARRDEKTLEPIEATILEVNRDGVTFDLSGQTITAPLNKLEGVILGTVGLTTDVASPPISVLDVYNSTWSTDAITLVGSEDQPQLEVDVAGTVHSIDWNQIQSIRFKSGLFEILQAEVADSAYAIADPTQIDESLAVWFRPRSGREISMVGGSSITFRVPEGYSKLVGSVQRDSAVQQYSETPVAIAIGDETQWTQTLRDREILGFELSIGDARRMTLSVDRGQADGIGDQVVWRNVRLIK